MQKNKFNTLERIIELQMQFEKQDVTPIVINYLGYLDNIMLHGNYSMQEYISIAICKTKQDLTNELIYKSK